VAHPLITSLVADFRTREDAPKPTSEDFRSLPIWLGIHARKLNLTRDTQTLLRGRDYQACVGWSYGMSEEFRVRWDHHVIASFRNQRNVITGGSGQFLRSNAGSDNGLMAIDA